MMDRNNRYNRLTIMQHNVRSWNSSKFALSNIYNNLNPDIILINEHSITTNKNLKIFNYKVFQSNKQNERNRGTAIAIKNNIHPILHDYFHSDLLAITIDTTHGPLTIATHYNPPRDNYLNYIDFHSLFKIPGQIIFIGDLNAKHHVLGHNNKNNTGKQLAYIINKYLSLIHI